MWFPLAIILYSFFYGMYIGEAVCSGPLDILITIIIFITYVPFACVMFLTHHVPEVLLYYFISGTLIYIIYRHIHKSKGLVRNGYSGNP